jgi:hypothetical protein
MTGDDLYKHIEPIPIGSMVLLYMVTWIPSIYPQWERIYTSTMDPSWDKEGDEIRDFFRDDALTRLCFPAHTIGVDTKG